MLSLLLTLAAVPQSVIPPLPPAPQSPQGTMRVYGPPPFGCPSELIAAQDQTTLGSGLMWRDGGEPVGLYRLLDRRVNGCPAPIVVNYRVPGSNALGREIGRAPTLSQAPAAIRP